MSEDCPYCQFSQTDNCRGCWEGSHYKPKPITNADRIRAMTDEELAVLLGAPTIVSPPWCEMNYDCPYIDQDPVRCDLCALEWLKSKVKE